MESTAASEMVCQSPNLPKPAAFTKNVTRGSSAESVARMFAMSASLVRSAATAREGVSSSPATSVRAFSLRATSHSSSATCRASSCRANSRPSPEDAPVMMATRFEGFMESLFSEQPWV